MDFAVTGLDALVGSSDTGSSFASLASSDPEAKHKWCGSGFLKQGRSGTTEDDWRSLKLSKTESMLLPHRNTLLKSNRTLFTEGQQQMLCFSSPKSDALSVDKTPQRATLPYFHLTSSAYGSNTGYNSGSFSSGSMHGALTEARGPFTQSQWMELEHQALIYKYITANVPIPSSLLIPIRKAVNSAGITGFSGGLLRPNTVPWGAFHLGFSSNADPEPGRCRRTDGKKWRCSRDAVADQKYCERHMNRGRHRSRKPVEGQSGQSAAATTTSTASTNSMLTACSTAASVMGPCSSVDSKSLTLAQHQLQPYGSTDISDSSPFGRMFQNKGNAVERVRDILGLSMLSSNADLKSKENPVLISKQHNQYEDSSRTEFGLVTSDSLLNPSHQASSINFGSSQNLSSHQETVSQHPFRQFMDDWPKTQSDHSAVSWPELDSQTERTQLSISIPMAAPADFMSSTSSPNNEKTTLPPFRSCRELDPIHMGLGIGSHVDEANQRQTSWIPISWESSMGGPLGEVLHSTNSSTAECKNSSALNLMLEGWDSNPKLSSTPTGVLQKTIFGSLSNSSAGSSPRAENNKQP
uniref:Growth-regulating factor n=1 Tax=Rhizophora mucronata TaxID=61149 RepID=A0A2P2KFR8_RHIMU